MMGKLQIAAIRPLVHLKRKHSWFVQMAMHRIALTMAKPDQEVAEKKVTLLILAIARAISLTQGDVVDGANPLAELLRHEDFSRHCVEAHDR